jgi:hypothetical protein
VKCDWLEEYLKGDLLTMTTVRQINWDTDTTTHLHPHHSVQKERSSPLLSTVPPPSPPPALTTRVRPRALPLLFLMLPIK